MLLNECIVLINYLVQSGVPACDILCVYLSHVAESFIMLLNNITFVIFGVFLCYVMLYCK